MNSSATKNAATTNELEITRQLRHVGSERKNYLQSLGLNLFSGRIEARGNYNVDYLPQIQPCSTRLRRIMEAIRPRILAKVLPGADK
jgi:hypothetical protein